MTDRKQQIQQEALNILVTQGYAGLSMRAVARASGLKLGALQYHYPTRPALIRAITTTIAEQTAANFETYRRQEHSDNRELHAVVDFLLADPLADALDMDALFEQLWAMAVVEPIVRELLDELYEAYLAFLEDKLRALRVDEPRADALVIMSMLEGITQFVGKGRRWSSHAEASVAAIHRFLDSRYATVTIDEGNK